MLRVALASPPRPLDDEVRAEMEGQIGHDLSGVRVHADSTAAAAAHAIAARACTIGVDVIFAAGEYQPDTTAGRELLAHELIHAAQLAPDQERATAPFAMSDPQDARERQAAAVSSGAEPASAISHTAPAGMVHRQHRAPGPVTVRMPVLEEALTQLSDISAANVGRSLTAAERALARPVFGRSIDLDRVRLIPTDVLEYRVVGNNIRVPDNFTIADEYMAETLIHELTHVWQYQHTGTSYMSHSIQTQIAAGMRGNRNYAYDYVLSPDRSFFDFTPEQQGTIVQHYFAMLRDQSLIAGAGGAVRQYDSNHQGPDGFPLRINASQRTAEIGHELPEHQRVIGQMQAALPADEAAQMLLRASEVMTSPRRAAFPETDRGTAPLKPLLELRF
jgi:hypothetical protein